MGPRSLLPAVCSNQPEKRNGVKCPKEQTYRTAWAACRATNEGKALFSKTYHPRGSCDESGFQWKTTTDMPLSLGGRYER